MDISDPKVYEKISYWIRKNVEDYYALKSGKQFYHSRYHSCKDQTILSCVGGLVDDYVAQYGPGPHDIKGTQIKAGDEIAIAVTYNRGGELLLDTVVSIKQNGPVISHIQGKYRTYRKPENCIVL